MPSLIDRVTRVAGLPIRLGLRGGAFVVDRLRRLGSEPPPPPSAPPPPRRADPPPAPPHVSEGAELVAESADPEVRDGVGAQLDIAEPWRGYDEMVVAEVVQQLSAAPVEAAAAVRLYEGAHRSRRGVLNAAERRLRG
jgi:hypothetical protein